MARSVDVLPAPLAPAISNDSPGDTCMNAAKECGDYLEPGQTSAQNGTVRTLLCERCDCTSPLDKVLQICYMQECRRLSVMRH